MASSLGYDRMTEKQFAILEAQLQKQSAPATGQAELQRAVSNARRRGMRSGGMS